VCGGDHPEAERFAVQKFSIAGRELDRVPDGVTKVQECADVILFAFIRRNNRRFDRQTPLDEEREFRSRELPAWIVVVRLQWQACATIEKSSASRMIPCLITSANPSCQIRSGKVSNVSMSAMTSTG
jgi:hypothetical protein